MELSGSAQAWLVAVVRDMAADVAARADFDLDAIFDLCMAVDEACLILIGQGGLDARLRCAVDWDPDQIRVTVQVSPALPQGRVPTTGFGWRVLSSLVDEVSTRVVNGPATGPGLGIWLSTKHQPR